MSTALTIAYMAVKDARQNTNKASMQYTVPGPTLCHRLSERVNPEANKSGPTSLLTVDQQSMFAQNLSHMAESGYGYSRADVVNMTTQCACHLG